MTDRDAWRLRGVYAAWSSPEGSPAGERLDLTVRVGAAVRPLASALREIQRSIPGTTRVVVLSVGGPSQAAAPATAAATADAQGLSGRELADVQRAFDWATDPSFISVAAV